MALMFAVSSFVWLATGEAASQAGEARVSIVMSKLPAQNSASYQAIRRHAGDAAVESLTLTKTEIWSLSPDKVDAVKAAANRHDVGVDGLAADWNHVFRTMPAHTEMSEAHKRIMAEAKSSKATVGVGMMLPPRAAMLEYALTRGARAQTPPTGPAKIVLRLNEATALTLVRTSVDIRSDMCVWRGTVEGTGALATILWWPGVTMAGTVRHEGRLYSIHRMRGGVHAMAVVEMSEDRMPPEHAPMPERLRARDPSLRDDPLYRQGDASLLRSFVQPARSGAQPKAAAGDTKQSAGPKKVGISHETVINVIVAHTSKAAQKYSDFKRELAEFSIEEANQSFRNSNLGHIKLELVHTYKTDYVEDGEHFDHLWRFADKGDGYMEEIHALRERYDADLAILIVDDAKGCGLATRVYADADEGFAVVHHECAATTFSVAHEIGHLIGARHELQIDKVMTPFPYGHGYVNGTKWRDIMSYKESCGGCQRLPIWSSPKVLVDGDPAGTTNEDNARVIAEEAGRVASFRPSRFRRTYGGIAIPSGDTADQASKRK